MQLWRNMVLYNVFRSFIFCFALLVVQEVGLANFQENKSALKCILYRYIENEAVRDLCYDHGRLNLLIENKNLSTIDLNFILELIHEHMEKTRYLESNLARFVCASLFHVCVTKPTNTTDANDSSVQIVPPCRSLCKSAKKNYMLE